jgi:hypothetical protein
MILGNTIQHPNLLASPKTYLRRPYLNVNISIMVNKIATEPRPLISDNATSFWQHHSDKKI